MVTGRWLRIGSMEVLKDYGFARGIQNSCTPGGAD